jgi:hypothetical protein
MWRWILVMALGGEPATVVDLGTEATLSVPAEVRFVKDYRSLPPELSKSAVYQLPDGAFLMVNVTTPSGAACTFDRQMRQLEDLKKEPNYDQLHHFPVVEQRHVGDFSAFYTEGGSRTLEEAQAGIPFHVRASYSVCLGATMLGLTLMPKGAPTPKDLAMLKQVVSSIKPVAKAPSPAHR